MPSLALESQIQKFTNAYLDADETGPYVTQDSLSNTSALPQVFPP